MELVTVYEGPPHSADAVAGLLREAGLHVDYVPPSPYLAGPMLSARVRVPAGQRERAMSELLHSELDAAEAAARDEEPMPPRFPPWMKWTAAGLAFALVFLRYLF
ncbi:MAG: hypothetical protein WD739_06670 [Actinomycetota bacterium]